MSVSRPLAPGRKAKIVCTIGPATEAPVMLDRLIRGGMDVARLNCSHGDHGWHARMFRGLMSAAARRDKDLAVLADLQGPKIRTVATKDGRPLTLRHGERLVLSADRTPGVPGRIGVSDPRLPGRVGKGDRILLDDGLIELRVERSTRAEIRTTVIHGGPLGSHKGINLPGVRWQRPPLTAKDRADLDLALRLGVSYIALSFIQSAKDVKAVKDLIHRTGRRMPLIAKLEKPDAITDLENILDTADGIMIARGDLGVELGPEKVPMIQKRAIQRAHAHGLPVITATQMLESMTHNPRPTRAEVSDVANAVFDDTDAVMLSGETASGDHPLEALAMMDRVVREAEASRTDAGYQQPEGVGSVPETIADAVRTAAAELKLGAIAAFTEYGRSAQLISLHRPKAPIVAFSTHPLTRRRLAICWGVTTRSVPKVATVEALSLHAERVLMRDGLVRKGDHVAFVAGTPVGRPGHTNLLKLFTVGNPH